MLQPTLNGLIFACRKCGASVPAGPLAVADGTPADRLLLDRACPACAHRALYRLSDAKLLA